MSAGLFPTNIARAAKASIFGLIALALPGSAGAQMVEPPVMAAGKATIYRDHYGMPHIYAAREEDGFFGLGYAIAEDRLEQILLFYLATRGELAANFGAGPLDAKRVAPGVGGGFPDTVESDTNARRFRYLETARANLVKLPPQFRRDLESYIQGIEKYLADHPERRPAWTPKLEPAMPLAVFALLVSEGPQICSTKLPRDKEPESAAPVEPRGSDAWVIGRSRTANGGIIMSSDSHGPWSAIGTLFYAWRMKAGDFDVQAFEPTGSASPFFGHTNHYAWGWTEGPRFPGDCYAITTEGPDSRSFKFDGRLRRIESVPQRVEVKDGAAVAFDLEYTAHNNVFSPIVARRGAIAYAASYAAIDDTGRDLGSIYALAKAEGRPALEEALGNMNLYPANLIIGGGDGTLFYIRPGRIPKRRPGLDLNKPLDGNSSATAWTGFISYPEALKIVNPAQDYIVNNNVSPDMMYPTGAPRSEDYPAYYAFKKGQTTSRQRRSIEILEAARQVTDQDAIDITMDEKVIDFDKWAKVFAALRPRMVGPDPAPGLVKFVDGLIAFDGILSRESRPALYFSAFWDALQGKDADARGEIARRVIGEVPLDEGHETMIASAAGAAYAALIQDFGSIDLVYGDVHRVGRGQEHYPVGGGGFVVGPGEIAAAMRAMSFQRDDKDRRMKFAYCCQRVPFVVSFDPEGMVRSYSQLLPGISDDPQSRHFDDQARLASERSLRPNLFYLDDLLDSRPRRSELSR
ncbi:penicillin acylase family protein [Sphingosinicella rhizophila]|uniref:Penicillin acylase family protein n=1 Tax=Sphingosinicella rhizophila TaxID=3050082 RepID=A0ABU3QB28_9SPHN|nr:penicillin acylase family protein [Sphingosinicella sp. GR2756]MDT9600349.1 penicillin acylase family protein [Sphingosinicella sp. GR2756]